MVALMSAARPLFFVYRNSGIVMLYLPTAKGYLPQAVVWCPRIVSSDEGAIRVGGALEENLPVVLLSAAFCPIGTGNAFWGQVV